MSSQSRKIPSYRQAVVGLDGHDNYLGKHGAAASHEAYNRLIAEWLVTGKRRPP